MVFLRFQSFQGFADAEQFLALLLVQLGFLQQQFALGGQDGSLDVTESADDLALEFFQFSFQVGLIRLEGKKRKELEFSDPEPDTSLPHFIFHVAKR